MERVGETDEPGKSYIVYVLSQYCTGKRKRETPNRWLAAEMLGKIGDTAAKEALFEALKYHYSSQRIRLWKSDVGDTNTQWLHKAAKVALVSLGEPIIADLQKLVTGNNVGLAYHAAEVLAKIETSTLENKKVVAITLTQFCQEKCRKRFHFPSNPYLRLLRAEVCKTVCVLQSHIKHETLV